MACSSSGDGSGGSDSARAEAEPAAGSKRKRSDEAEEQQSSGPLRLEAPFADFSSDAMRCFLRIAYKPSVGMINSVGEGCESCGQCWC